MKDTKKNKKSNNEPKWKKKKESKAKKKIVLDIGETTNEIETSLDDTSSLKEVFSVVEKEKEFAGEDAVVNLVTNVARNKTEKEKKSEEKIEIPIGISKEEFEGAAPLAEEDRSSIRKEYENYTIDKEPENSSNKEVAEETKSFRDEDQEELSVLEDVVAEIEDNPVTEESIGEELPAGNGFDDVNDPDYIGNYEDTENGIQPLKSLNEVVLKNEQEEVLNELPEALKNPVKVDFEDSSVSEEKEPTEQLEVLPEEHNVTEQLEIIDEDPTEELEILGDKTEQLEIVEEEPIEELEAEDEVERKLSHTSPLEAVQNIVQGIEKNPEIESELEKTHDYDVFEPYKKKDEIRLTQSTTTINSSKPKVSKEPKKIMDLKKSWKKAVHYNYSSRIATLLVIILVFFILFVVFLCKAFGYEMGGSSTYSEYTTNDYFVCGDSSNSNCLPKDHEYNTYNIDHINVKFTYDAKYSSSVSFDAKYYVAARLRVFDVAEKTRLKYTKEEMIIDRTPLKIGGEVINFSTDANINYNSFKQLALNYMDTNGEVVDAQLEVALYLETDDVSRKISYITIPLTQEIFNISVSNLDNQNQLVVFNTVDSTVDPFYIFISIICLLMDVLLFLYLYNFMSMINHLESKYTIKLRRILKNYDKYIVNATAKYTIPEDVRIIDVDRIEELVDARNSLDKPIIYDRINNIKSKFYVEDGNIVYCFTLKDDE